MTHDEIAQLDADGLRLAIAKAKGWNVWACLSTLTFEVLPPGDSLSDCDPYGQFVKWKEYKTLRYDRVPDWPRDIAAAWELVEEMQDQGACVEMGNGWGDPDWRVRIMIEGSYRYVWADTAPLAICRAWLMWKQT